MNDKNYLELIIKEKNLYSDLVDTFKKEIEMLNNKVNSQAEIIESLYYQVEGQILEIESYKNKYIKLKEEI